MKIVFIGDSLTYAYRIRRTKTWVSLINLEQKYNCINKGINGDTTTGMLARYKQDVIAEKPKMVHIMGGANDLICATDLGVLKSNVMAMVHQAQAAGIKPVLGASVGMASKLSSEWAAFVEYDRVKKEMAEFRNWLHEFSDFFGIKLIDYNKEVRDYYDGNIDEIYSDGLHLNEKGNEILAQIFIDNFTE